MSPNKDFIYHIGTVGTPWGEAEKQQWLSERQIKRSYKDEVLTPLQQSLPDTAELLTYGTLDYSAFGLPVYELFAVRSKNWQEGKPVVLVTGGVHGYETSGVQGALKFVNLLVLPCISPWGYETINRWNPKAVDPNRSFGAESQSDEATQAMAFVRQHSGEILVHIDLHETTDSDNSEFRPAKAARDGTVNHNWNIPDGFYLVGDSNKPEAEFQRAIIEAVQKVTHIAEADEQGCLIGEKLAQFGVVNYPKRALGLCGGMTEAKFVTTTEVYPDSPKASPEQCNAAQVAVICAGVDYALAKGSEF
jgi:hypothetical protein